MVTKNTNHIFSERIFIQEIQDFFILGKDAFWKTFQFVKYFKVIICKSNSAHYVHTFLFFSLLV